MAEPAGTSQIQVRAHHPGPSEKWLGLVSERILSRQCPGVGWYSSAGPRITLQGLGAEMLLLGADSYHSVDQSQLLTLMNLEGEGSRTEHTAPRCSCLSHFPSPGVSIILASKGGHEGLSLFPTNGAADVCFLRLEIVL